MLKPPTAYRPPVMRALTAGLGAAWRKGVLPPPDLEPATVIAQARAAARTDDFGDEAGWRPALDALLCACREEARLNRLGRTMTQGQAVKVLIERARTFALMRTNPAWAERPLAAPLVIAGPMRSGTTRLQRLLALHPGFVHLRLFEAMFPVPVRRGPDWRPWAAGALLAAMGGANPAILAVHPMRARWPDEELGLFEQSFWGAQLEAQRPIAGFARWCEAADAGPAYAHLALLLRMIGGARGDDPQRPWLLKTPQHMANLPALMAAFPGARVVMTHRDPAAIVASSASLAWQGMVLQTDTLDPAWVGGEWLFKTRDRMERVARDRAALPHVLDVDFAEATADPLGAMARVLAFAGLDFPAGVRAAAAAWLAREDARGRHRAHRYRLEDFGLEAGAVRAELGGAAAAMRGGMARVA